MPFVGIDIAKRTHEAVFLDDAGEQIGKPLRFPNTRAGAQELLARLHETGSPCICALEATGHYWLALYSFLRDAQVEVSVLNPLQTDAYRQSFLRKTKTDRRDSWVIADLVRIGRGRAAAVPDQTILQLRELTRFRFSLIDQIADLKRKIVSLLDRVFPEYETLFTDIFRKSSRALLAQAATADEIAAFDLAELTALLDRSSRGRFGAEKAREIQALAAQSLGVSFLVDAVRVEIRCLLAQITFLESQLAELDAQIAALLARVPAGAYLTTIKGVGPTLAASILAEIGDVRRFADPKKLVAFAGLDPSVHQSGQFHAEHATLSKRGSPFLRRAIWLAAHPARQWNPDLQEVYERKLKQGKCHQQAIAAVAHRLLNRIYVVLKEQRPFVLHTVKDASVEKEESPLDNA
jgi:transposase